MPLDPMIARPFVANPFAAFQEGRDQAMQNEMNQMRLEEARNAMAAQKREPAEKTAADFRQNIPAILSQTPAEKRQEVLIGMRQHAIQTGLDISLIPETAWTITPEQNAYLDAMAPAPENRIGTASPSDFTSESLGKYQQTGDPAVLVRQYPPQRPYKPSAAQIVMTNQGPMRFEPDTGNLVPLQPSGAIQPQPPAQPPGATGGAPAPQTILPPAQDPGLAGDKAASVEQAKLDVEKSAAVPGKIQSLQEFESALNDLDSAKGFDAIFGTVAGATPSFKQESVDADAYRTRVVSLTSLENREKLKGSGAISDFESKTLERAGSVLANPRVSPAAARKALADVRGVLDAAKKRLAGERPSFSEAKEKRGALMDSRTNIDDLANKYAD